MRIQCKDKNVLIRFKDNKKNPGPGSGIFFLQYLTLVYNLKFPKLPGEFVFKDFNKKQFIKYVYRYEIDKDSDSE